MPDKLIAKCEICSAEIGVFGPDTMRFPMLGNMFESPNPKREIPPPFRGSAAVDWLNMRCPMCNKRPFLHEHKIMTPDGYWDIYTKELEKANG